jgi:uncharacterized protein
MSHAPPRDLPVSREVFHTILDGYALEVRGIHGVVHWARVLENGRRIADPARADPMVLGLFAVFHDSRRVNDDWDPGHGHRGAALARTLRVSLPPLTDAQFDRLCWACEHHTDLETHPDVTVQACFDSDRLDLARVGIVTDPARLCTGAARDPEVLAWAIDRAKHRVVPDFVEAWLE